MAMECGGFKDETRRYITDANAAIHFKLIRNSNDIADINSSDSVFHPEFSHQFFGENETIFGYTGLEIKLYYMASTLDVYFGVSYDEKIDPKKADSVKPDDIVKIIEQNIPKGYFTKADALIPCLQRQREFSPFGNLLHSYEIEENGTKRQFQIFKVDEGTEKFFSHYQRLETFALWYIDAASYIDTDDPLWKYYITYEKYQDENGNQCYAFCGYSTVYHYYAYPDKIRPRIGHILVLPPFQKHGHGVQLLQCIYNDLVGNPKVLDITAEDPSDNFIRLRDFVDCTNCLRLPSFAPSQLKMGFSKTMAEEAQQKLKMTRKQARRVYEILRFKFVNASDKEEFKQFRLDVKRRLFLPFQKDKRDWQKLSKALNPDELTAAAVSMTPEQRMYALQKQFEDLLDAYRLTLNKLAMKMDVPQINLRADGDAKLYSNGGEMNGT